MTTILRILLCVGRGGILNVQCKGNINVSKNITVVEPEKASCKRPHIRWALNDRYVSILIEEERDYFK